MKTLIRIIEFSNYITKALIIVCLFALLINISCSASENKTETPEDCNCEVQHYLYVPNVGHLGGSYQLQYSESIDFDCINNEFGVYYPVSNVNYNYDKIVCE